MLLFRVPLIGPNGTARYFLNENVRVTGGPTHRWRYLNRVREVAYFEERLPIGASLVTEEPALDGHARAAPRELPVVTMPREPGRDDAPGARS